MFLVLALGECPNTVVKTIYGYSMELSADKRSAVLIHADTQNNKVKDFHFLISRKELKDILKKRGLPFTDAQFYQIETLDGGCFYVFESFKTRKK